MSCLSIVQVVSVAVCSALYRTLHAREKASAAWALDHVAKFSLQWWPRSTSICAAHSALVIWLIFWPEFVLVALQLGLLLVGAGT